MTNGSIKDKNQTERITYQQAYEKVKEEVDRTLSTSPFVIREYMKHLSLSTGKYIRTASLLACAMDQMT